ncbi:hypothetical protein VTJ83DRAFT_6336 [Remersonia thermophila]|uniref:HIT-type domain-containing protein n=1 Tax=Remersonia thermophila TaxID=72144 RepID=A0ABR4D5X3_9PEZI
MSGTVLSTLCGICHSQPPKYKCPRCGARTCSVQCVQKHKARADCNGQRNPAAYVPLNRLKTDAGIDHDYNFLASIERARQQAEREIVESRQLLAEQELHPPNEDRAFHKIWQGEELRHVPVHKGQYKKRPGQDGSAMGGFDRHVRRRLRYLDIEVVTMPQGMARQKENQTSFNRRTQTINWQVEWLVFSASELDMPGLQDRDKNPLRVVHKSLEGTPIHRALATALNWHCGQLDRQSREGRDPVVTDDEADSGADEPPRKKRKTPQGPKSGTATAEHPFPFLQQPSDSAWLAAPSTIQSPFTSAWSTTATRSHVEFTPEEQLTTWRFYLVRHSVPTKLPTKSTATKHASHHKPIFPLSATDTLSDALPGRTVLEFPTLIAVPPGANIPEGYAVGDWPRRPPRERNVPQNETASEKRQEGGEGRKRAFGGRGGKANGTNFGRGQKRAKLERGARFDPRPPGLKGRESSPDSDGAEEGEIDSEGEDVLVGQEAPSLPFLENEEEAEQEETEGEYRDAAEGAKASGKGLDGEEGEAPEEESSRKPGGGLVDYGSSDED